jgi:hypothetical protein
LRQIIYIISLRLNRPEVKGGFGDVYQPTRLERFSR